MGPFLSISFVFSVYHGVSILPYDPWATFNIRNSFVPVASAQYAASKTPHLHFLYCSEEFLFTPKPLTSGVRLNHFLPSHLSIHLSWSAVKQDLFGKELLINNTWPVWDSPPPLTSSVTLTSPLTLTCFTFSLPSAVFHLDFFLSSNPPASFLFPLLFPSSLALNRPLAW